LADYLITIARWQSVHEITLHLVDLVGADLGEAVIEWLCPEEGGRVSLIMPVFLEPLRGRNRAVAVQGVDRDVISVRLQLRQLLAGDCGGGHGAPWVFLQTLDGVLHVELIAALESLQFLPVDRQSDRRAFAGAGRVGGN
jgi:hypothetical protein